MPQQVTEINVLRNYLRGVMNKADHHGPNVNEVVLALAGSVVWRKDDKPIEVLGREGEMKNVLWFRVDGTRYALSYNHDTGEIELRQGTIQGSVIGSFSNTTTNNEVRQFFARL